MVRGGSAWESNPPRCAWRRATGFEDQGTHRDPTAPGGIIVGAVKNLRPPSVERVLAAVRPAADARQDRAAVLAAARDVVDAEREAIAAGAALAGSAAMATVVVRLLMPRAS